MSDEKKHCDEDCLCCDKPLQGIQEENPCRRKREQLLITEASAGFQRAG